MAFVPPPFTAASFSGVLHHYTWNLVAFEFLGRHSIESSSDNALNTLLFIGGLFDGLLTVPYIPRLVQSLPPSWRLVQPTLSSSYLGFGTTSLTNDVLEIAKCLAYIRKFRPKGKVVMMGHSTGCQDIIQYMTSPLGAEEEPRTKLDGAILQAGCSDREAILKSMPIDQYESSVALGQKYIADGHGSDVLLSACVAQIYPAPISAERWLSFASPPPDHDGEDDLFSSDLSDKRLKRTFGTVGKLQIPLLILFSGADQFVPEKVDKEKLVTKWVTIVEEEGGRVHEGSGVIPGADHALSTASEEVTKDVMDRVQSFLESL